MQHSDIINLKKINICKLYIIINYFIFSFDYFIYYLENVKQTRSNIFLIKNKFTAALRTFSPRILFSFSLKERSVISEWGKNNNNKNVWVVE